MDDRAEKRKVFEHSLTYYTSAKIWFHTHPSLCVPPHLNVDRVKGDDGQEESLSLTYTLEMDPIVDEVGIRATFVFAGEQFPTFVPWDATAGCVACGTPRSMSNVPAFWNRPKGN